MLNTIRIKLIELLKGIPQEYVYIYSGIHPQSFLTMLKSEEINAERGRWYDVRYVARYATNEARTVLQLRLLSAEKSKEEYDKLFEDEENKELEDWEKQEMTDEQYEKFYSGMGKLFKKRDNKWL